MDEKPEPIQEEFEMLLAIYQDEVKLSTIEESKKFSVEMRILPRVGEESEYFVFADLQLLLSSNYPEQPPQFIIKKTRGITDEALKSLSFSLKKLVEASSNESCCYQIIELACEEITDLNSKVDCSICLFGVICSNKSMRLSCWHTFHENCLIKWLVYIKQNENSVIEQRFAPISKEIEACRKKRLDYEMSINSNKSDIEEKTGRIEVLKTNLEYDDLPDNDRGDYESELETSTKLLSYLIEVNKSSIGQISILDERIENLANLKSKQIADSSNNSFPCPVCRSSMPFTQELINKSTSVDISKNGDMSEFSPVVWSEELTKHIRSTQKYHQEVHARQLEKASKCIERKQLSVSPNAVIFSPATEKSGTPAITITKQHKKRNQQRRQGNKKNEFSAVQKRDDVLHNESECFNDAKKSNSCTSTGKIYAKSTDIGQYKENVKKTEPINPELKTRKHSNSKIEYRKKKPGRPKKKSSKTPCNRTDKSELPPTHKL